MSTLNKKLTKPSGICFMNKDRGERTESIVMDFGGSVRTNISYLGWKQNGYVGSYQFQYKVIGRLTPENQFDRGSSTTSTDWKYTRSTWSGDVDKLNRGVQADVNHTYYKAANFFKCIFMTPKLCDKFSIRVRVRPFNISKKTHGEWVYATLTVYCAPVISIHKIVALPDGGVNVYLNMNGWKRGNTKVVFKNVHHAGATKSELTRNEVACVIDGIGGVEAENYPYVTLEGKYLSTDFLPNEKIVFENVVVRTADGVDAPLNNTYVIDPVSIAIDQPYIAVDRDEDKCRLTVSVMKGDASDDWDEANAYLKCVLPDGKVVKNLGVVNTGSGDEVRYRVFDPPLDCELRLYIRIRNSLGNEFVKEYTVHDIPSLTPFVSKGRVIINYTDGTDEQPKTGMFNGGRVAVMNYDVDFSSDSARSVEKELPFGRKKPVAFLGDGIETSISVKGSIDATPTGELQTVRYSGLKDWEAFKEQQGIVLLRMANGVFINAVCTQASIKQEDEFDDTREVTLSLVEVAL